jgi:putative addiction module component (TIGR02574 family)
MTNAEIRSEIFAMSVEDRIQLVSSIWDSIAKDTIPVSEEHQRILQERLKDHQANPSEGTPWREVLEKLRNQP